MRLMLFPLCFALVAIPQTALAVCLQEDYSVRAEYSRSVAVVIAKVVSQRTLPDPEDPESYGGTVYRVKVQESFRGSLHGMVDLFSENSSGRFPMVKGDRYILFLYRQQGQLSPDNCGNSGLLAQKQEVLATVRTLLKSAHAGRRLTRP